ALGVGSTVVTAGKVDWPLVRLLERAAVLNSDDLGLHSELLSRLAIELYWEHPEKARALGNEALEAAERSGDERVIGLALHGLQFSLRGPARLNERIAIGKRLAGLAAELADLDLSFEAHTWLAADILRRGDMAGFLREMNALERTAEQSREPLHRWYALVYRAELAAVGGRPAEARRLTEEAAGLGTRLDVDVSEAYRLGQLAVVARDMGTLVDLEPEVRQAADRFVYFVTLKAMLALLLAEHGRTAEARAEIDRLAHDRFSAVPTDSLWETSIALLAEAAALSGSSHVSVLAELLDPHAGEVLVQGLPSCWGAADRVRGVVAAAEQRWEDADHAFAAALACHQRMGAPGWVARTKLDQARSLLMRGRREDAQVLAEGAQVEASALGLDGIAAAAGAIVAAAPMIEWRGLSRREREVLGVLASGATNKEIADSLIVSVNTVERHLANIYTKIGARSRSEATAFAVRNGLA
ncbi:MAG TPA: helix-turn-helix transcriptional regulator, partial [Acidimicrobiales bacterium]